MTKENKKLNGTYNLSATFIQYYSKYNEYKNICDLDPKNKIAKQRMNEYMELALCEMNQLKKFLNDEIDLMVIVD